MKLATWNVECARPGAGARSERLRAAMSAISPDVWVLTEAHPDFSPGAGYVRAVTSTSAPDRVAGGCWVVIWHRCELRAEPLETFSEPERSAAIRLERPGFSPILIVGTVLPWRGDQRYPDRRGATAFRHSLEVQAADWDRLRAAHPDSEIAVAGDFNQELDAPGPVGTRDGQQAFREILSNCALHCLTGGAADPLLVRGWRASIDHILISAGLRGCGPATVWPDVYPLPRGLSDHHGMSVVVADV